MSSLASWRGDLSPRPSCLTTCSLYSNIDSGERGYAAATLTTLAFVPQVLHTWRTRSVGGISAGMYAIFITGVALWLAYGILLDEWPIIVANGMTLVMALAILIMKIRYRGRPV